MSDSRVEVTEGAEGAICDETIPSLDTADSSEENALVCSKRRNVRRMYASVFFLALANSVAFGAIFDMYLYQLTGRKNTVVGLVESINGLVSLIAALPVAYCVDNFKSRARVARVTSIIGAISILIFIAAILVDSLFVLVASLAAVGLFYEMQYSSTEAIFADSCAHGERSKLFVRKSILFMIASAVGPLLSALGIALLHFHDQWPMTSMHIILIIGALCGIPCFCISAFFEDMPTTPLVEAPDVAENDFDATRRRKWIPYLVATSDFVSAIGAGMTVKFFNLFFTVEEKFTALDVCLVRTAYPLVIALFQYLIQRASTKIGRAQASFLAFLSNVACFLLLWKVEHTALLIAIFLIRGGLANSVRPIDRSILMDYTPSTQRGCWNAVESLSSVTWSGSAFLGGYLVDQNDYRAPFVVTAVLYACASMVYFPLLFLVPKNEQARSVALEPLIEGEDET